MDVNAARLELRKMNKRSLFILTSKQKILKCPVGGRACGFLVCYKGFNFCISEISGQGCQERESERLDDQSEGSGEIDFLLPLIKEPGARSLGRRKKHVEFRVYCRDKTTRTIRLLGSVTERRTKERGKNLDDLLVKAVRDYSRCAADPSQYLFLVL